MTFLSGPSTAALIEAGDRTFYGTTVLGGAGFGTIFSLDAAGSLTTRHSFTDTDGRWPMGRVIEGLDGSLYGTVSYGGTFGDGTVSNSIHQGPSPRSITSLAPTAPTPTPVCSRRVMGGSTAPLTREAPLTPARSSPSTGQERSGPCITLPEPKARSRRPT